MTNSPSVLFVNQHYAPDVAATAQTLADLAEHLADDNFEVHLLCSQGHYLSGEIDVPAEETRNGVHVHRVRTTAFGRDSTAGRLADYLSFFLQVLWRLVTGPSYDCIVSLTTPPMLHVATAITKAVRGQPFGIWSMDLHPDAEVGLGMIERGGTISRMLNGLNNWAYCQADFVVDLGKYMKQRIQEKGVPDHRLQTIPVWSKKDEVYPVSPEKNPLFEAHEELLDRFVVMYSGNAGLGHRFDEVMQAMDRLKDDPDVFFLFVGDGPRKKEVVEFTEKRGVENFSYLPYFSRDKIKYSLSLADAHLITLRQEIAGIFVPEKLYGILASGKPALMVGPEASEPGNVVKNHDVGFVVDPNKDEDPVGKLVDYINRLREDEDLRESLGSRGRELFLDQYEKERSCNKWNKLLSKFIGE